MQNENVVRVIVSHGRKGSVLYEITLAKTVTREDGISVTIIEARYREQKMYYTFYHVTEWKKIVYQLVQELENNKRFLYSFKKAQKLFVKYRTSKTNFSCTT